MKIRGVLFSISKNCCKYKIKSFYTIAKRKLTPKRKARNLKKGYGHIREKANVAEITGFIN